MFNQQTLPGFDDATSLGESVGGNTLLSLPAGQQTDPSGAVLVRASRSRRRGSVKAPPTAGIFGQNSCDSSPSVSLQRSLESRLRAGTDVNGSPEYVLTWKHWGMRSGPRICALRARGRRTSDSDFTGWATPTAQDHSRGVAPPRPMDTGVPLSQQVAGWATPAARDFKSESAPEGFQNQRLKQARGKPLSWQVVPTAGPGESALNPAMSRWLQGYPATWDSASPNFDHWQKVQERIASAACEDMATR